MHLLVTYHKNNFSFHERKMIKEIILTMHVPGTSHWAQLAAKIRVDNTIIVAVFIVVKMSRGMSVE